MGVWRRALRFVLPAETRADSAPPEPEVGIDDLDAEEAVRRALARVWAGDRKGAKQLCRAPAEAGHRAAAYLLSGLAAEDFLSKEIEFFWRKAITGLGPEQAHQMGVLLGWDPKVVDREYRLRVRVEQDDLKAMYELGCLLTERGDQQQASIVFERVKRCAAERGDALMGYRALVRLATHPLSYERALWEHARRLLGRAAEDGDLDARVLLGHVFVWTLRQEDAERSYKLAAEAGHIPALAALGDDRIRHFDDDGAEPWLRRAAEAGHPAAAYNLVKHRIWHLSPEEKLRWSQAAFRAGHPTGVHMLCHAISVRGWDPTKRAAPQRASTPKLQKDAPAPAAAPTSPQVAAVEVISGWDELMRMVPEGTQPVEYLSRQSGLARSVVNGLRLVRNRCAHPAERGLPSGSELEAALATVRDLRRRLSR